MYSLTYTHSVMKHILLFTIALLPIIVSCSSPERKSMDYVYVTRTVLNQVAESKGVRDSGELKIGSGLLAVIEQYKQNGNTFIIPDSVYAKGEVLIPIRVRVDSIDRLQLYIERKETAAHASVLTSLGTLDVANIQDDSSVSIIQGWTPVERVLTVAKMSSIRHVRPVTPPLRSSSTTAQMLRADAANALAHTMRTRSGSAATEVSVGVISDDCGSTEGLLNASKTGGRLGAGTTVIDDGATSRTHEGLAMMELVQQVAPDAKILFATGVGDGGITTFIHNIHRLASAGAKVIVDDLLYREEPAFSEGRIDRAINAVSTSLGVVYVAAAGNFAKNVYSFQFTPRPDVAFGWGSEHWIRSTIHANSSTDFMQTFTLSAGQEIDVMLQWDDPFEASQNDFDLYLVDIASQQIISSSTNTQNGSSASDPYERMHYIQNPCWGSMGYRIEIVRFGTPTENPTPRMKIMITGLDDEYFTPNKKSIFGHAAGSNVIACGAMAAINNYNLVHSWSSRGDVEIVNVTGPIDALTGMRTISSLRQKPDVSALDAITTGVPGFTTFSGTSAAAPLVAGIAAILFQSDASATREHVINALKNGCIDYESPGIDELSGYGRVDAFRSLAMLATDVRPALFTSSFSTSAAATTTTPHYVVLRSSIPITGLAVGYVVDGYMGTDNINIQLRHISGSGIASPGVDLVEGVTNAYINRVNAFPYPTARPPTPSFLPAVGPLPSLSTTGSDGKWEIILHYPPGAAHLKDFGVFIY